MEVKCDLSVVCQVLLQNSADGGLSWHSSSQDETRDLIKQCIKHLIQEKRKDVAKAWENTLNETCGKIEEKLYQKATSIEQ